MIVGMNKALGEIPVTVKLRTGVKDGRNTAHKLMPRLGPEFGAGCITVRHIFFNFWNILFTEIFCLHSFTGVPGSNGTLS